MRSKNELNVGIYYSHYECFDHTAHVMAVAEVFKKRFPQGDLKPSWFKGIQYEEERNLSFFEGTYYGFSIPFVAIQEALIPHMN